MTTIVYKDRVLAADTRAYSGDKVPIGTKRTKIRRLKDGSLIGASSSRVGQTDKFMNWVEATGADPAMHSDVDMPLQALLIKPDGAVYYWNDLDHFSGPIEADYFAIGSGNQYALGALLHDPAISAADAVEIACVLDTWSEVPVVTLTLQAPSPAPKKRS